MRETSKKTTNVCGKIECLNNFVMIFNFSTYAKNSSVQKSNTESQNHGMVEVGKDIWRSCTLTPSAKADSPRAACPGLHSGITSKYLHRRRLQNLSGRPVPVLCQPQRFFFLHSDGTFCIPVCAHCCLSCC